MGNGRLAVIFIGALAAVSAGFMLLPLEPAAGSQLARGTPVPRGVLTEPPVSPTATPFFPLESAGGSQVAQGTPVPLNIPPTAGPGTPTITATPTSVPAPFAVNFTGESAAFVYVTGSLAFNGLTGPPECGSPTYYQQNRIFFPPQDLSYAEAYWPTQCIPPLGKITLGWQLGFDKLHGVTFRPEIPAETFANNESLSATGIVITAPSLGEPFIVEQPAACSTPTIDFDGPMVGVGDITITWPSACVLPGDDVIVHLVGSVPGESNPFTWQLATPTPTDTPTPTNTPTPTATPTKQPAPGDTDLDGCSDAAENGPNADLGGLRNYVYFWDFYDVWTHPAGDPSGWERNRLINVFDILQTAIRFGPGPQLAKVAAFLSALQPPVDESSYHAAYDRGEIIGANNWDRASPDGSINIVDDILGVAAQFGHDCT